jgi:hypothetical protein
VSEEIDYEALESDADHLEPNLLRPGSTGEGPGELILALRAVAQGEDVDWPDDDELEESERSPLRATSGVIISRAAWGARKPKSVTSIALPTKGTGIHWTGPGIGKFNHDRCAHLVRGIQNFHMDSRGWADIAYNMIPCPHGYVFVGRGPGRRSAANGTNAGNGSHYASCWLGGQGDDFGNDSKIAINVSIEYLRNHGQAGESAPPHSAFKSTECCGNTIRSWLAAGRPVSGPTPLPPEKKIWRPSMLLYSKRGTVDGLAAIAAHAAAPQGAHTESLSEAKEALSVGVKVFAIGGPAVRELPEAIAVSGQTALDTIIATAQRAKDGWKV